MDLVASIRFCRVDIRRDTDYEITPGHDMMIVHLLGSADHLRTRSKGVLQSSGSALSGEYWCLPSGVPYYSYIYGEDLFYYAEINLKRGALVGRIHGGLDFSLYQSLLSYKQAITSKRPTSIARASREVSGRVRELIERNHGESQQGRNFHRVYADLGDYIRAYLSEALTLDRLSIESGKGPHALLRGFKGFYGVTPAQFIINERVRAARRLMASKVSLTSIAYDVGFSNSSHLSAIFKKKFGFSASDLRAWQAAEKEKFKPLLDRDC
ncbi:MAG: helix-turn-helix domain-containing protein [Verrucomicrobiales bacterium]